MARLSRAVFGDDDVGKACSSPLKLTANRTPRAQGARKLGLSGSSETQVGYVDNSIPAQTPSSVLLGQNARALLDSPQRASNKLTIRTSEEDRLESRIKRAPQSIQRLKQYSFAENFQVRPEVLETPSKDGAFDLSSEESLWSSSQSSSDESDYGASVSKKARSRVGQSASGLQATRKTPRANVLSSIQPTSRASHDVSLCNLTIDDSGHSQDSTGRPGTSSSDKENHNAVIQFSPKQERSPAKRVEVRRPVTPTRESAGKSRLQSPSKKGVRIPTPPGRPSLDVFWNAQTVNEWNDQHSPRKQLTSPRKMDISQGVLPDSPLSSPRKRTKAELAARRAFDTEKHDIAASFLAQLDAIITSGQIQELSASTGGVSIRWSKTLNSTAGRANWRRTSTKTQDQATGEVHTRYQHFASIELAEKVIDDEHRLLNVVAHEFCHLATFMISEVKNRPHGQEFKMWGRKCSTAFAHRGITVTTKHSYAIDYKYIWRCESEACGVEYKRHSKSINPIKDVCGACRTKLRQIKPVPRKAAGIQAGATDGDEVDGSTEGGRRGDGGGTGVVNGYAAFVKSHFAAVKQSLPPGTSHKKVMEALGAKYRADRDDSKPVDAIDGVGRGQSDTAVMRSFDGSAEVDDIATALEVVTISNGED